MQATDEDSIFRVGELGGQAPLFLSGAAATEIAEMLSYRLAGNDPTLVDFPGTIAAHARGQDPCTVIHDRRRELPTILILTDRILAAHHWHTLMQEFEVALASRGVAHERIEFPGSFFEWREGQRQPRPEAVSVQEALDAPGWTVTTIFAEAHRLSHSDIGFLEQMSENGPVLFLDLRDPYLWDRRHAAIAALGISIVPATAAALRDGLAEIFAPDRANKAQRQPAKRSQIPSSENLGQVIDSILGETAQWAGECALVQPISYALAENLRAQHVKLATPNGQLAFFRLAALPGSWAGPEGLRFAPEIRRYLLNRFSRRPEQERAGVSAIIDEAFGKAPTGETANSIWRYARAQARLFSGDMDDALVTIEDIKDEGLVSVAPVEEFFTRLRMPGSDEASDRGRRVDLDSIVLPARPLRASFRRRLSGREQEQHNESTGLTTAEWAIGLPETRIRYGTAVGSVLPGRSANSPQQSSDAFLPVEVKSAAFLMDGRHLVIGGTFNQGQDVKLALMDPLTGSLQSLKWPLAEGEISAIRSARESYAAVFAVPGSPLIVMRGSQTKNATPRSDDLEFETISEARWPDPGIAAQMAISPDGNCVAFANQEPGLQVIRLPSSQAERVPLNNRITALAFIRPDFLIAGLADGTIVSLNIASDKISIREDHIYRIDGVPIALAAIHADQERGWIVAAVEDGRVRLLKRNSESRAEPSSQVQLSWPALRVVAFADRPAVYRNTPASDRRNPFTDLPEFTSDTIGLSIAVLGTGGGIRHRGPC
jgi:hypothetical protein